MSTAAVSAAESSDFNAGPGLFGFLVLAFLIVALVLLYRSMRKQMRKVDFDQEGLTDEERMRGQHDQRDQRGQRDRPDQGPGAGRS
ncbi:hypothetical protein CLV30_12723 [Haloactinopolyspora alba]|uniref:Uncharacterized protein n=1 Tax=Haloactinopolyspora alba TaxID=648780 RepID=A0A2P8DFU2_9ACTN|nr:hypothetical protein [Haloactinopolyspora alba]PSK96082.1 hypothetical protein CLV30_12723 [Haloactinopolyspora alba]